MKIYIDDMAVIRRQIELPEECPRCKRKLEPGTVLTGWALLPREERSRLVVTRAGNTRIELAEVLKSIRWGRDHNRLPLDYRCQCNYILAQQLTRRYELAEMDRQTAFKLRGLLYDSNAKDDTVQRKCYDETQGYHGDCFACNIEAEIGTEEVPHPIDPRLHTCVRDPEHVQHQ